MCRLVRLVQDRQADAEGAVRRFAACDGLKDEVHRPAPVHDVEHGGDVGEHAGLGRDGEAHPQIVDQPEQKHCLVGAVGRRIDPDYRVAAAVHQAVKDRRSDAFRVVGRVIGLETDGEAARQPEGVAEPSDDADFPGDRDQVLVAHQLRGRSRHLRRYTQREFLESLRGCRIRKEPVSERADSHRRHGRECCGIMAVEDESRDFISFAGDNRLVEKAAQRNVRQRHSGRDALLLGAGGEPSQAVAGAVRACPRQERAQVVEHVMMAAYSLGIGHYNPPDRPE